MWNGIRSSGLQWRRIAPTQRNHSVPISIFFGVVQNPQGTGAHKKIVTTNHSVGKSVRKVTGHSQPTGHMGVYFIPSNERREKKMFSKNRFL